MKAKMNSKNISINWKIPNTHQKLNQVLMSSSVLDSMVLMVYIIG